MIKKELKKMIENQPEVFLKEDRLQGSRKLEKVARKELEGEPNVEGMKLCAHCDGPVQYQWTSEKRAKMYCSEYCRDLAGKVNARQL